MWTSQLIDLSYSNKFACYLKFPQNQNCNVNFSKFVSVLTLVDPTDIAALSIRFYRYDVFLKHPLVWLEIN